MRLHVFHPPKNIPKLKKSKYNRNTETCRKKKYIKKQIKTNKNKKQNHYRPNKIWLYYIKIKKNLNLHFVREIDIADIKL